MFNNNCSFMGRLTKDPEVQVNPTSGKTVTKFSIAVDNGKDKNKNDRPATFVNFVAFEKAAEAIGNHATKGTLIGIRSRYENGSFEGQDGKKVYYHNFVVDEFKFFGGGTKNDGQIQPNQNYQGNGNNGYPQGNGNNGYPQGNSNNGYPQGNGGYQDNNGYPQGNPGYDGPYY